ncbi:DUF6059 family protein [Streptomyces sp. NPDC050145]|uniref:DUF6059 family protein n=1 Tax=Streptomyces sp. NPDC050145 TaxID=3365602 RepID=UPI0037913EC1
MSAYRRWHYRLLRQTWKGLVAMGTVHLAGEMGQLAVETARTDPPSTALQGPPAGHPEQLCPEIPLSVLELRLLRELGRI